jgi:Restriction endonuclease
MKLTFEANLGYQQQAIKAVVDLFDSQRKNSIFDYEMKDEENPLNDIQAISNSLIINNDQLQENLNRVQTENSIEPKTYIASEGKNFSIQMETGTGKTYVYLRTIYELNAKYGFKKFVIVVPSIAIKEGVLKNLEITYSHFQNIYGNVPLNFNVYDSKKVSMLRAFAINNNIDILVINIDSFAKDANIINRSNDKLSGRKPIEFIQCTNPIVIVDEPQNMETDIRKNAIDSLSPLCTLRYSATHKYLYNLIYQLDPVKAYDMGLVKKIEVDSVIEENSNNNAYIYLKSISTGKNIRANIEIDVQDANGIQRKLIKVGVGDDLLIKSNKRDVYRGNYVIEEISIEDGVKLANGTVLQQGGRTGGLTDEIMQCQIEDTIKTHFDKELKYKGKGIKVLSLFFIDRVSNYRYYESGQAQKGRIAQWFEQSYNKLVQEQKYKDFATDNISEVHNGYFSQDKKGFKDTNGESKDDNDTYSLIMKDKERLLDNANPLRFIFSHSALREGWDNPNVFQICTLNETHSEIKKRQEVGRGLRLAVNQDGNRVYDQNINCLTVIANESYADFANKLQTEMQEDCGVDFTGRIKDVRKKVAVEYRKGFELNKDFKEIWDRIKFKTTYRVNYSTTNLIEKASQYLKDNLNIKAPSLLLTKSIIQIGEKGVGSDTMGMVEKLIRNHKWTIPDVIGYIENRTHLTRKTIQSILISSGKITDILKTPQMFLDSVVSLIKQTLYSLMIEGIKYKKIEGEEYQMSLFSNQELEIYLDSNTFEVRNTQKTIYDKYIPLDSSVETRFAEDCESNENIKFYFKLPFWFKIPTPIGNYNPDWAVVFQDDKKVYFVAETKYTGNTDRVDLSLLRTEEQQKIACGKANFKEYDEISYRVVNSVKDLVLN